MSNKPMPSICIVGAGQLGSRHLQALQGITKTVRIQVIDPSDQSLKTARERFEATPRHGAPHTITFGHEVDPGAGPITIAIIATNAETRRVAIEKILSAVDVQYCILEKLLFTREDDYSEVPTLLQQRGVMTWVNCSMRTMPFYIDQKKRFSSGPILFRVTGSQYGLITNSIHYIDYLSFLTNQDQFSLVTDFLDPAPFPSKRPGFLELSGTLQAHFADGSIGSFSCYRAGDAPILMEIFNEQNRCISRENESLAWISRSDRGWTWQQVPAPVPYQSVMTTAVVEQLLASGNCPLVPLQASIPMHLTILNGLQSFLNKRSGQTFHNYPFT